MTRHIPWKMSMLLWHFVKCRRYIPQASPLELLGFNQAQTIPMKYNRSYMYYTFGRNITCMYTFRWFIILPMHWLLLLLSKVRNSYSVHVGTCIVVHVSSVWWYQITCGSPILARDSLLCCLLLEGGSFDTCTCSTGWFSSSIDESAESSQVSSVCHTVYLHTAPRYPLIKYACACCVLVRTGPLPAQKEAHQNSVETLLMRKWGCCCYWISAVSVTLYSYQ